MPIIFPEGHVFPRIEYHEYLNQQQKCSLLVDVASQMAKDWQQAGEPGNRNDTSWTPTYRSTCDVDELPANTPKTIYGAQYKNFTISNTVIWTVYSNATGGQEKNRGPAVIIATEDGHPQTAYVIFRGTLGASDFALDLKYGHVPNPIAGGTGNCHEGFTEYFQGCGINSIPGTDNNARPFGKPVAGQTETLYEALHKLPAQGVKHLVVTGHSLGSAVATLATAWAVTLTKDGEQIFETVRGSVSASPRVGDNAFKAWFDGIQDRKGNDLKDRFWRLTNTEDGVPKVPGEVQDPGKVQYTEVGYNVHFTENYLTSILASLVTVGTVYEIVKKGLTNWHNMGLAAGVDPKPGVTFTPTAQGVVPPVFPKQEGTVKKPKWQANPNHNPCCCYAYAINHPDLTRNLGFNKDDDDGGNCHYPVVSPPPATSSTPVS
jgi:hypothetical protein|tara:strand:+ start:249 stop:1544 length:1296 start_codon:yes stop_codon:yes gene_type:complete